METNLGPAPIHTAKQNKGNPLLAGLLAALLAVAGCGRSYEPAISGAWIADVPASQAGLGSMREAKRNSVLRAYRAFTITFRSDHTFTGKMFLPLEGNWSVEGDRLRLMPGPASPGFKPPELRIVEEQGKVLLIAEDKAGRLVLSKLP
jgi:hypothetical protein